MKLISWILIITAFLITSCTEEIRNFKTSDLPEHNMKIIPDHPTSKDQIKLIIYDDCTYNVLSGVNRDEKMIVVEKKFNSMMKWPCIMKNDTIEIGQLTPGNYILHYKLIDTSTQVTNPEALSLFFNLIVSE